MAPLIPKPHVNKSNSSHLIPLFLQLNPQIAYEHERQYHKGYLTKLTDGIYCFSYKSYVNKKVEDWGVQFPNLTSNWHELCADGLLIPGHASMLFIFSKLPPTSVDTIANFVSAVNPTCDCPSSLLTALAYNHLDWNIWQVSYLEEKQGIQSLDTYDKLILAQYQTLWEKGTPRAIPTICILTIKPDKMMNPLSAKLQIIVLGNHEDFIWTKSKK